MSIPVVAPARCPGCGDGPETWGPLHDVLFYDPEFCSGSGGYVRIIGWLSCANHVFGTVIDSFDADCTRTWEGPPSTEHVYILNLPGRRIESVETCTRPVRIV